MKSAGIKVTQSQRLQLNTSLQASIRLLRADASGLSRYLEEQAAENPAIRLDYAEPSPGEWLPRWTGVLAGAAVDEAERLEAAAPSLIAHVLAEVGRLDLPVADRPIALALIEMLEPSGWLGGDCAVIAAELSVEQSRVEAILVRLQQIEPAGLFARNLRECLWLQLRAEGLDSPVFAPVLQNIDLLARGDFDRLAQLADASRDQIQTCFRQIRTLNPKPGAQFAVFGTAQTALLREPDLVVDRGADGWTVRLNRSALPSVSVEPGRGAGRAAARSLAKMVKSRNATLLRVGQEILRRQAVALDDGLTAVLPMSMSDLAATVGLHESTISRIVAGASVDTPHGTWWLRALFSGARGQKGETALSAAALKARLAELVAQEDPHDPLSDDELADRLVALGATAARRTVARWREALGIPPAHRRRKSRLAADDRKRRIGG